MLELTIPKAEFENRQEELLDRAEADGYDGVVLFGAVAVEYISGLFHMPTERPLALGVTRDSTHVVVPKLEEDHVDRYDFAVDEVHTYFEYPQGEPMAVVGDMCEELGIAEGAVAADSDGSPARNGYTGPALSEVISGDVGVEEYVTDMREVKSEAEIELIQEASRWANLAHRLLQENIDVGKRPVTLSREIEAQASDRMLDTLGDQYRMQGSGAPVSVRFTTGEITYRPHSVNTANRVQAGDNIVSIVKAEVGGYETELERTMFVGEPSEEQRNYFDIVMEAQQAAIDTLAAGVPYAAVDEAVSEVYEKHGVTESSHHHTGHNIGLEFHERPFLDVEYEGTLRAGELYTVEPGLFVPGVGGFRHSDTVLVTEDGSESLTYYPKEIDEMIIDV